MAGIEDVARLAGVSTATVSRTLSGKPHVSDRSRSKVELAAKQLGYLPASYGFSTPNGKHQSIGIVMPIIDRWFFSAMLHTASQALAKSNYDLVLFSLDGSTQQRARVLNEISLRRRIDALITIAVKLTPEEYSTMSRLGKTILSIGGQTPGARSLSIDDKAAGRLATEHLISLGHKRIGIIAGTVESDMSFRQPSLRRDGYHEALEAASLEELPIWTGEADFTVEGGYRQARQILGDHRIAPTAIFCVSDEMAFGAIMAAKELGLKVPEDVSIIGFDNHDLADFYELTTISQDVRGQAKMAAAMVVDLLKQELPDLEINIEQQIAYPIELIIRSSTARHRPEGSKRL